MFTFTNRTQVHRAMYTILAFYWMKPSPIYRNNHAELYAMLDSWLLAQHPISSILHELSDYPITTYPDVCVCGHVFNSYNCVLRLSCHKCQGRHTKQGYFTDYVWNKIAAHIHPSISIDKLKRILTEIIYNEYHRTRSEIESSKLQLNDITPFMPT